MPLPRKGTGSTVCFVRRTFSPQLRSRYLSRQPLAVQVDVVLVVFQEHFRHDAPAHDLFRLVQDAVSVCVEALNKKTPTRAINELR